MAIMLRPSSVLRRAEIVPDKKNKLAHGLFSSHILNFLRIFEPTCAYCMVASYVSLSVRLSGIIAVTGRANCQRQVAFFKILCLSTWLTQNTQF